MFSHTHYRSHNIPAKYEARSRRQLYRGYPRQLAPHARPTPACCVCMCERETERDSETERDRCCRRNLLQPAPDTKLTFTYTNTHAHTYLEVKAGSSFVHDLLAQLKFFCQVSFVCEFVCVFKRVPCVCAFLDVHERVCCVFVRSCAGTSACVVCS